MDYLMPNFCYTILKIIKCLIVGAICYQASTVARLHAEDNEGQMTVGAADYS